MKVYSRIRFRGVVSFGQICNLLVQLLLVIR